MGLQLRVSLPNQPGALARVAAAIARTRVDVLGIRRTGWLLDGRPTSTCRPICSPCPNAASRRPST
jgi:hypothetical protein